MTAVQASFRTKVFIASFAAAAVALTVVAILFSWQVSQRQRASISERISEEARLIADLISATSLDESALDAEADRLGRLSASRVTLIADDGRVVGDSTQTPEQLRTLDNHGSRQEVAEARSSGIGTVQRFSDTIGTDMFYVAARANHPVVRVVRLAVPLTEVDAQLRTI